MKKIIDENNIGSEIWDSIEARDETKLKSLILLAMQLYLQNKLSKDDLDSIGILKETVPIELKWTDDFILSDTKLNYVMEELCAIEVDTDKKAKEKVRRFILYLQDKDYEHLETKG